MRRLMQRSFLAFILLLRTTAFVPPRPLRAAALTLRHESVEELQAAAAKLREEIKVEEALLTAATAEKNAIAQERDAEKAAERAEKDKVKNAQKRQKVLTLCRDRNATAVGLVLLNDGVNKRKDVQAALDRAGVKDAEGIMQRAHRNGAALIGRFDSLNDTYAFEPAYDTYAKLNDRGLNVAFVPVPADDGDDERLEALAELRDMAEGMDVDILNEEGTDLTAPAKVIFGAVSLVTAFIGVSLALLVGDSLGALLGQWLGGGSGGAPPGF
jgi:ATP-dependent Clp protease adapter protein ClpS